MLNAPEHIQIEVQSPVLYGATACCISDSVDASISRIFTSIVSVTRSESKGVRSWWLAYRGGSVSHGLRY